MTEGTYLGQHYQIIQPRADRWMGWDDETETELTASFPTERQALNATLDSIEEADREDPQFAHGKQWRERTGDPTLDNINPDDVIPYLPTLKGWEAATRKEETVSDA